MTARKTLNERVIEAKALASLSKIESRDKHGRVKTVIVPASNATRNHVIIRRFNGGIISCECRKEVGAMGHMTCNGNLTGVCRHSIAAVMVAMQDQGYTPRFRKDYQKAKQFAQSHADVVLSNPDSGGPIILTLKSHEHGKNFLYLVAVENAAVELQKHAAKHMAYNLAGELVEMQDYEFEDDASLTEESYLEEQLKRNLALFKHNQEHSTGQP